VSSGVLKGRPLEDHPFVGDLSDRRKVNFDDQEEDKPGEPGQLCRGGDDEVGDRG